MKIIIEGNSNEGKTLMASMIEKFLQKSGFNPIYEDDYKNKRDIIYIDIGDYPVKFIQNANKILS